MISSSKTINIILERGTEDKYLLEDIYNVFLDLGIKSTVELARRYPVLYELKQTLQSELPGCDRGLL